MLKISQEEFVLFSDILVICDISDFNAFSVKDSNLVSLRPMKKAFLSNANESINS
jgi:hypothetical protein